MNSICFRKKVRAGWWWCLAWCVFTLPAPGQTSRETGEALEQTSLAWNATGWTVGGPVRGRPDALMGTCPVEAPGPALQTTITGPAKLVFDWTVQGASEGTVLGLSVDGHELPLETPHLAWRCVELQIPAGAHAVTWRPMPGATVYLDNVIYDAGQTMGFVLGMGDGGSGVWAVHTGSFGQTAAAARDGLTSAAQLRPDEDGLAVAYRLAGGAATEAVGISWWQRQVGNGHGVTASPYLSVMGSAYSDYDDYSSWHFYEKVAPAGSWIRVEGNFMPGVALPGALFLDDFKVEIRTLSWALDVPKLTWTAELPAPVPWRVAEGSAPGAADGRAEASHDAPFEATLTTTLQGPALFAVSHVGTSTDGIGGSLLPILNGAPLTPFGPGEDITGAGGTWMRDAVLIPPGSSTLSFKAQHSSPGGGSWILDQCNLLTPADAPVGQALRGTGSTVPVWSSQNGGASRDETTVRADGATLCLTPEPGRVSEIILQVTGPAILSFWAKAELDATLESCTGSQYTGNLAPNGGSGWELKTLQVLDGPQYMHLIGSNGKVWLDDLVSILTVPVASALDVTSDIPGVADLTGAALDGYAAQLPQGSGAVGDDAVIFPSLGGFLTFPFNSFPVRIRYRHLSSGTITLSRGSFPYHWQNIFLHSSSDNGTGQWSEADVVIPGAIGNGNLVFNGNGTWLDNLRIDALAERPWADANIPTSAAPATWQAFDGADRTEGICAVNIAGGNSSTLPLSISAPCDVSALWRRGRNGGPAFVLRCGAHSFSGSSAEWQPLHVHMDEATTTTFAVDGRSYDRPQGGEGMVDDIIITPQAPMAFSQAMDTNLAPESLQSPGWTAMGKAISSVETGVTFDGSDAIAIRANPGVSGPQSTTLRANFARTGFFHLRARRSGGEGAACTLRWTPNGYSDGSRTLTLSPEWSHVRECVNGNVTTLIQIEVTVDGDDPASAVYLDTFGWEATPSAGELLEAPAFTNWTSEPADAWTGGCHPTNSGGSASAMEVTTLASGTSATLTGTVSGPGFVVFNYADGGFAAPYTLDVAVGETLALSKYRGAHHGPVIKIDQVFVPDGTSTVSWTVRPGSDGSMGPFRLLSVSLVPGTPLGLLTSRLPAASGWRFGGDSLPQPLYNLSEGVLTPTGVSLPAAGSWIERDFAGPAEVSLGWYSDTDTWFGEPGRFSVDGQNAGQTYNYSYEAIAALSFVTRGVSIPPGLHRFRWERSYNDSSLIALGPCVAGPPVISPDDVGPVIWVNEGSSEYRWKSVSGNAFTGTTALSARDTARGECLLTGPGLLTFMLAQDGRSIFKVEGQGTQSYYFSSDPHGFEPVSLLIPPGPQRITFIESYCEPTDGTEIAWIDDMKFTHSGFAQWRSVATDTEHWGGSWEGLDSDEDGVIDEFEYAFGTNAVTATPETGPACTTVNGQLRLQFPALPYDTTGLRYAVDYSSDMLSWLEMSVVPANGPLAAGPTINLPATPRTFVRTRVIVD